MGDIAATITIGLQATGHYRSPNSVEAAVKVRVSAVGEHHPVNGIVAQVVFTATAVGGHSRTGTIDVAVPLRGYALNTPSTGTVAATVKVGKSISALHSQTEWPYALPTNFAFNVRANLSGTHGIGATVNKPAIVMTTGLAQSTLVSTAVLDATQTNIVVRDASKFVVGQQVDIYEVGAPGNRETAQVMAIDGKTLTIKPRLTKTHPEGAVVVAIGGAKGVVFPANGRLGLLSARITMTGQGVALANPFRNNIEKRINISCSASGISTIPTISGYFLMPPIAVSARLRGSVPKPITGTISGLVDIEASGQGDAQPMFGYLDRELPITMAAQGLGYTVQGAISKQLPITSSILSLQPIGGPIAGPIPIAIAAQGESTTITAIYGVLRFTSRTYAVSGSQSGAITSEIPFYPTIRGQAIEQNSKFGKITAQVKIATSNARGRLSNTGRVFNALPLGIIAGRTEVVNGVDRPVFRAIEGKSFLEPGVPVPSGFVFGRITGAGPSARFTITVGGTTGDLQIMTDFGAIMKPVTGSSASDLAAKTAAAINNFGVILNGQWTATYSGTGSSLTIYAPVGTGASINGTNLSFTTTGNRSVNNYGPNTMVGKFAGGRDGNIAISSDAYGEQALNGAIGTLPDGLVRIYFDGVGLIRAYSGQINAPVVINGTLRDGVYGISVAKLNVHSAVAPPKLGVSVAKSVVQPIIMNDPNKQHVAKAVAYAVLSADPGTTPDTYEAMFFF